MTDSPAVYPAPARVADRRAGGARRAARLRGHAAHRLQRRRAAAPQTARGREGDADARSRSPSSRAAGARSCPTSASSPTTARRRTSSSARSGSARRRSGQEARPAGQAATSASRGPVLPAMELIAVVAAAHPGEGDRYNLRQPDSRDPPLPEGRAQGQGAADPRHPARPLGLLHRDQAAAQVAQGARRRPRAGPRVADGAGPDPRAR